MAIKPREEPHIVAEFRAENGVQIRIADNCYRNLTEAQMEANRAAARAAAWRIIRRAQAEGRI